MNVEQLKEYFAGLCELCVITPSESLELGVFIGLLSVAPDVWDEIDKKGLCDMLNKLAFRINDPRFGIIKCMYESTIKKEEEKC